MKVSEVKSLWRNIKRSPIRTTVFLLVIASIGVASIWVGGFFGQIGKQQAEQHQTPTTQAILQIVALAVEKPHSLHPVVDLKLLNNGEGTAFLTEVSAAVLERVPYAGLVKPSGNYDLLIDGDVNLITVSHDIKSNDVDRLLLRLGAARHNLACYFKLQLRLRYNGNKVVVSPPFEVEFIEEQ